jgi:hypothetical protein
MRYPVKENDNMLTRRLQYNRRILCGLLSAEVDHYHGPRCELRLSSNGAGSSIHCWCSDNAVVGKEMATCLSSTSDSRELNAFKWNEFWVEWPGCGNYSDCSARTPCGNAGCNYIPPDTSTRTFTHSNSLQGGLHTRSTSARSDRSQRWVLPDPGPTLSVPVQTPNTTGTDPPSMVDPPGVATIPGLQGVTISPQAAPQTSADWSTVWEKTSGLMRMFAKSEVRDLTTAALLCLLMLHFAGISLL